MEIFHPSPMPSDHTGGSDTATTPSTTPTIPASGGTVQGNIQGSLWQNGSNIYQMNMTAGQTYKITVTGQDHGGGTLAWPALDIHSPDPSQTGYYLGIWHTHIPGSVWTSPSDNPDTDVLHTSIGALTGDLTVLANGTYVWNKTDAGTTITGQWHGTGTSSDPVMLIDTVEHTTWTLEYVATNGWGDSISVVGAGTNYTGWGNGRHWVEGTPGYGNDISETVTAGETGTYGVQVSGDLGKSGTYTLSITPTGSVATVSGGTTVSATAGPAALHIVDTSAGNSTSTLTADPYSGPVAGLQSQFIAPHSMNIATSAGNVFLQGAGNCWLEADGGGSVLSGGPGSNFLVGGAAGHAADTFFVDTRGGQAVWSSVANFHTGDAVTMWGVSASTSYTSEANGGAPGYTGYTIHSDPQCNGSYNGSITLVGVSASDVNISYGTVAGISFMYIVHT